MENDILFLITSYYIIAIILVCLFLFKVYKNSELSAILTVRMMYILIYAVVPILTFTNIFQHGKDYYTRTLDLSVEFLNQNLKVCFLSLIGYFMLEIGYSLKKYIVIRHIKFRKNIEFNDIQVWKASLLMTFIAFISFLIWSYPFGGPLAMIKYGTMIRSGYEISGINNKFGFMKHFVPLIQFSSLISLGLFRKYKRCKYFIHFIVAFSISIIYLISNDGRAPFLMYFISILILWNIAKKNFKGKIKFRIVSLTIIGMVGFLFIKNLDFFMDLIRKNEVIKTKNSSLGIFSFLYTEFSWTVRNPQAVYIAKRDGIGFRLLYDILSAFFSLLPSYFTPEGLQRLEKINTIYWLNGMKGYGGKPTDIIVTGLYQLGYMGAIMLPLFYGYILKRIDDYFLKRRTNSIYYQVLFVQLIYQFIKTIAYADFALVVLNLFYIVVGHFIVCYFNKSNIYILK